MPTNVTVPAMGESVTEAVLLKWSKNDGEMVARDEAICELETDKANTDIFAPEAGVVRHVAAVGATVKVGDTLATIDPNGTASAAAPEPVKVAATVATPAASVPAPAMIPTPAVLPSTPSQQSSSGASTAKVAAAGVGAISQSTEASKPASNPALAPPSDVRPSERGKETQPVPAPIAPTPPGVAGAPKVPSAASKAPPAPAAPEGVPAQSADGPIRRAPMSKIRKKIAENLVRAQQTAAILTTFNEVDLTNVMELRTKYKEKFEKSHGVGLGFMSFFVKACCQALSEFGRVNGSIDGGDLIYHDYVHMGIAVSTERGLAVPVIRNAHTMSMAKIESEIKRVANSVREGKLGLDEMSGGTFTITNGGVFGSLLSTPILNPPQAAILGMHTIQKRPMVVNDAIVVRPMMYLALSYDHRLVDGKESVSFLVRVKELLEDPSRLLLGV